ncbi:hypothetical protein [Bernardetia sp. MNP-M8]|uniref:hypothetical protein n=1 Tax=Bernardetia sp. MNP-M8 TaxID=3127470 RepID=UPI0030D3B52F
MKIYLFSIFTLVILTLTSCEKPIKVFQIDTDVEHKILKLYKDSTFVEEIDEIEDSYQYLGNWTGSLKEGSTFKTIATRKGYDIITLTPIQTYRVINGQAVEINENNK